jgi:hypothetical protein
MQFVLLVTYDEDYSPPDAYGPFPSIKEAEQAAERYRAKVSELANLIESSAESNEAWTAMGWWFGIVPLGTV